MTCSASIPLRNRVTFRATFCSNNFVEEGSHWDPNHHVDDIVSETMPFRFRHYRRQHMPEAPFDSNGCVVYHQAYAVLL